MTTDHIRAIREALSYYANKVDAIWDDPDRQPAKQALLSLEELEKGLGWSAFPQHTPEDAHGIGASKPLLFVTRDKETHVRMGYYRHGDKAFYESGDEKEAALDAHSISVYAL